MAKTDGSDLMEKVNTGKGPEKPRTLKDWIQEKRPEIATALPKNWDLGAMESALINALRANPNLAACTPISFVCAMLTAAQLGLKPNTPLGQCYIIPYWNSKIKRYEAQFQLGYKGLIEMGYRTDTITEIYAEKVKVGDFLDYQKGTEKFLHHKEFPERWEYDKKTGEPLISHYYAVYKTIKGGMNFSIWTKDTIIRHKDRFSPAARKDTFSPWTMSEDLMGQKTVLKDVLRYAPLSENDRRILSADESVKREMSSDMLSMPSVYEFNPEDLKGMDDVKFKGEIEPPSEDDNQETPGQEKGAEKGTSKGIRPESTGQDQTGQQDKDGKPEESLGGEKLDTRPATQDQIRMLFAKAKSLGYATPQQLEDFKNKVKNKFKLEHFTQIARFQFDQINEEVDKLIKSKKDEAEIEKGFEKAEQSEML